MVIKNVSSTSYKLITRGFMTILFSITIAIAIYYNINNNNILKHYAIASPVLENTKLFMINIPKDNRRMSSSRQIIKYHKSNQENIIPVKINKVEKNTGTLSLLSLSFEQNNNTYDSKQKNIILKKLDTINKKLKKTLKQLQATTTKTFINFNFNHTQLIEDFYPNQQINNVLNSKYKKSSYTEKQKNSIHNSSIPKLCRDYLKYFQKSKEYIEVDSNKPLKTELELVSNREIKNINNKKKYNYNDILEKETSSIIESKIIHISSQPYYSSLASIHITKSDMKLNNNALRTTSKPDRNEKKVNLETILERNTVEKEKVSLNESHNDNKEDVINDNLLNVNKTNNKKNDNNLLNQELLDAKILENNIFASPGGFALLLFILYAIFMF